MTRRTVWLVAVLLFASAAFLMAVGPAPQETTPPTATPFASTGGLPGRSTATPGAPFPVQTAHFTPVVTSPFTFPTSRPTISPTPAADCTTVFPLESVLRIEPGQTTIAQLEAAFGQASRTGGRPLSFYFVAQGCEMKVAIGVDSAEEVELTSYGDLGWLLEELGPPAAVGVTGGNLAYLFLDHTLLLYPESGVLALIELPPDELTRETPLGLFTLRRPFEAAKQLKRLNAQEIEDWQPPLR